FRDPERTRRERYDLHPHVFAGDHRRIPGVDGLPAGERTDPLTDRIGVAGCHHDIRDPAANAVSDDLREHRVRTLALRRGAAGDAHPATRQDAHGDPLERAEPGAFHVVRDADTDIAPLRTGALLASTEAVVVGQHYGARLAAGKIPAR